MALKDTAAEGDVSVDAAAQQPTSSTQDALEDLTRRGAERGVDVRPGLALVEEELRRTVASDQPFVEHASRYLIDAGGKRFRPLLVLLCGMLGGVPTHPDLVSAGVIVELVHLSTLYHDDVIDAADARRGMPAAHVKWSNTVAILVGDFLLARASERSAALGVEVTRIMARTIADLCAGQIREVRGSAEAARHGAERVVADREHYLAVIGDKTASLISASCRLGALLSGQPAAAVETLTAYGWRLGMSFQLADDVLDIASPAAESGKVPGTDLREGVHTLPVLLALEAAGPQSRLAELLALIESADTRGDDVESEVDEALALLRSSEALVLARDAAQVEATAAKAALEAVQGNADVLAALRFLADYAADRAG